MTYNQNAAIITVIRISIKTVRTTRIVTICNHFLVSSAMGAKSMPRFRSTIAANQSKLPNPKPQRPMGITKRLFLVVFQELKLSYHNRGI